MLAVKIALGVLIVGIVEFILLFLWVVLMEFIHRNNDDDGWEEV